MEERKQRWLKGSFTVEMAFFDANDIIPDHGMYKGYPFYYHDKNIIAGAAYETAVVGSTKAREKDGIQEAELKALFQERVGKKCILFPGAVAVCSVSKEEIRVSAVVKRRKMSLAVESRAAVTEPERYIRDIRRIKK